MKRFGWLTLIVASLAFSSMGMAASEAANCKKVSKSILRVCNTYNAHVKSLETFRDQLKRDRQTLKNAKAHIKSLNGVYKAIRDGKGKNKRVVQSKIRKMNKTGDAVLAQLDPLAKRYRVYNTILTNMIRTKDRFAYAFNAWLKKATNESDDDDSDDIDDADDTDDADDADDADDLDDIDDSEDKDDSDDSDDADDLDDLDDSDDRA